MKSSQLIVITGMPGSGKTTLAKKVSALLSVPLVEKDVIKELLFDNLGWNDREWSKKLGLATYGLMDYFIEEHLRSGGSLIVESNFKPEFDSLKFQRWKEAYGCNIIQIVCTASSDVLYERFVARAKDGSRHPGHVDASSTDEWEAFFSNPKNKTEPIGVESEVFSFDTSDFSKISIDEVVKYITQNSTH